MQYYLLLLLVLLSRTLVTANPIKEYDRDKLLSKNLIVNPDFSQGNTGFGTDYIFHNPGTFAYGAYGITDNPNLYNPGFASCSDHTNDWNSLMMLFDGAISANKRIWYQTVDVLDDADYFFSFWATKVHPMSDPRLQIKINGTVVGSNFVVGGTVCEWIFNEVYWKSGTATQATIEIVNLNTADAGNDFAIDDLNFYTNKEEPGYIKCEEVFNVKMGPDVLICPNGYVTLGNENGSNPDFEFLWGPGIYLNNQRIGNPVCNPGTAITYYVKITNKLNNCFCYDTVEVKMIPTPIPTIIKTSPHFCDSSPITITVLETFDDYTWLHGDTGKTITVTKPGIYIVRVSNKNGCTTYNSVDLPMKKVEIEHVDTIDFGVLCYKSYDAEQELLLKNTTRDTIVLFGSDFKSEGKYFELIGLEEGDIIPPYSTIKVRVNVKEDLFGSIEDELYITACEPCQDIITVKLKVIILPIDISLTNQIQKCKGVDIKIGQDFDTTMYKFTWSPPQYINDAKSPNPKCITNNNSVYTVKIENNYGCYIIDTVKITVEDIPLSINASSYELCKDAVRLTASPGFVSYKWSNNATDSIIDVTEPGEYSLVATDKFGCVKEENITIKPYFLDLDYPAEISFGEFCEAGVISKKSLDLYNNSPDTLVFESVIVSNGEQNFAVEITNGTNIIPPGTATTLTVIPLGTERGEITGKIEIKFIEPCIKIVNIPLNGKFSGFEIDFPEHQQICKGNSINIGLDGNEQKFSYQWTPTDFLDNPEASNPLCRPVNDITYIVQVVDIESGCTEYDTVGVRVLFNDIQIISSSDYYCMDAVRISASEGFESYSWSNGMTGREIEVSESGIFTVTAIDYDGCISESSIEIEPYQLSIDIPEIIDFGDMCLHNNFEIASNFRNLLNSFKIDTVYISGDAGFIYQTHEISNKEMNLGDEYQFTIKSDFLLPGLKEDKLIVRISKPCPATFEILLKANVLDNNLYISLTDTVVNIGAEVCLPVYAYTDCEGSELPLKYQAEVSVDKTLFNPLRITRGILNWIKNIEDDKVVNFEDNAPATLITNNPEVINHICGYVMLGNSKDIVVKINNLSHPSGINTIYKNGNISADICEFDIRQLRLFTPTSMVVNSDYQNSETNIKIISQEEGTFDLQIFTSTGEMAYEEKWFNPRDNLFEKMQRIETSNLSTGVYFVLLKSPWNVLSDKLIIIK